MPVYKYKTPEQAERHLKELQPKDPLERLSIQFDLLSVLKSPRKFQRGIFKFKCIEEANRHREMLEQSDDGD